MAESSISNLFVIFNDKYVGSPTEYKYSGFEVVDHLLPRTDLGFIVSCLNSTSRTGWRKYGEIMEMKRGGGPEGVGIYKSSYYGRIASSPLQGHSLGIKFNTSNSNTFRMD